MTYHLQVVVFNSIYSARGIKALKMGFSIRTFNTIIRQSNLNKVYFHFISRHKSEKTNFNGNWFEYHFRMLKINERLRDNEIVIEFGHAMN